MSALHFVPPRVPLVDASTGTITREWLLFFQGLYVRVGGSDGISTPDLDQFMQFDMREADSGEVAKQLAELRTALALIVDPTAQHAELSKRCADLEVLGVFAA